MSGEEDREVPPAYTVTFNVETPDNVPEDIEIPSLELDIRDEGQISGDWISDGNTRKIKEGRYDFSGGIYPYPDEEVASDFYIAEEPGRVELDSDQEVTYVIEYDPDE